ncbi:hypothetical protein HMPREF0519_1412 [Lentilactobacillus hilgardii DSM 20176 = ATCC 8290]|uniref:Uncharacterized protein n=1 Tax=Lentilactobacillus hilgardii (strain ATCC 8290 / DSM 20176 / CCUG 30140 / JCM 1155 / KCTC 3500 / NBRC 15886 / NCIMB 8040 / NRRL B-1843 / 9) TaxID=1423757 RepID=C0XJK1_LENH9|nr:hypothetical protein HMPREF0519_1412 [Lentilactobacillus hilgardii DSM 20176 = ATCC 8290]
MKAVADKKTKVLLFSHVKKFKQPTYLQIIYSFRFLTKNEV